MKAHPLSVKITLAFILICAILWLSFGVITILGLHPSQLSNSIYFLVLSLISILAGIFLLFITYYLWKQKKCAWYLSVIFFIAGVLVNIFDDIGLIDVLVMIIHMIPLVLLIKDRSWYMN